MHNLDMHKAISHPCWHTWLRVVLVAGEKPDMDISSHYSTALSSTSFNVVNHPFTHVIACTRQQRHYGNLRGDALPPPPVLSELSHQNARQKKGHMSDAHVGWRLARRQVSPRNTIVREDWTWCSKCPFLEHSLATYYESLYERLQKGQNNEIKSRKEMSVEDR